MTKEQKIRLLMTLSRVEGAMYQVSPRPMDFLFDDLGEAVELLVSSLSDGDGNKQGKLCADINKVVTE
jgi:hypothetical protein